MKAYAGIDLHSSNNYLGVIDNNARRLYGKRLSNHLDKILTALKPFKKSLAGIAVESTFNWYWLVDGLIQNGYDVRLANPSAIKQYEGIKHTDDKWDAFWLAQMLRLNILPEGYIYPKQERPIRRFPKVGNYSSYCRCVKSLRLSDNKKKGEGNRKNGN